MGRDGYQDIKVDSLKRMENVIERERRIAYKSYVDVNIQIDFVLSVQPVTKNKEIPYLPTY